MKALYLATAIACSASGLATSAVPQQVINSCMKTESTQHVSYVDLAPEDFSVDEDDSQNRTVTTMLHGRHRFGIWESTRSDAFGMIHNKARISSEKIKKLGSEVPAPFTPFTAQWGEARYRGHKYFCITFNFEGLGESGSFQNVRGLYAVDMSQPDKFYYTAGDIRHIDD